MSAPAGVRATGGDFQKGLDWRTVKLIKDKYKIPLVIKGIATAEDAAIAVDHGVDWIYVSNHGGRQLDHGRGAMHVLPEIVERRRRAAPRSWSTARSAAAPTSSRRSRWAPISSASAACNAGRWRPPAKPGIVRMLELLEDEVIRCLGLLGVTRFAELDKSYLHQAPPTNLPHVFSAFPLLEIEPYRY